MYFNHDCYYDNVIIYTTNVIQYSPKQLNLSLFNIVLNERYDFNKIFNFKQVQYDNMLLLVLF